MLIAARIDKRGPKKTRLLNTHEFRKSISPSSTVTKFDSPPNSFARYFSILKKRSGENKRTRLNIVAAEEETTKNNLNVKSHIF